MSFGWWKMDVGRWWGSLRHFDSFTFFFVFFLVANGSERGA